MYKMNRPYLLLVCCLFLEAHLSAQTEIGVHFGVNSCSFYDFYPSKIDILNRARIEDFSTPAVGLYMEIPLNDFLSVQPELNFVPCGNSHKLDTFIAHKRTYVHLNKITRVNSLDIPVLIKLKLMPGNVGISVFLGFGVGYAWHGTSKGTLSITENGTVTTNENTDTRFDIQKNYRKRNLFTFGMSIKIYHFDLDVRLNTAKTRFYRPEFQGLGLGASTFGVALQAGYSHPLSALIAKKGVKKHPRYIRQ